MEKIKLVIMEKNDFENQDVIIDSIFGNFDRSRIGSREKTHALRAQLSAGVFQKDSTMTFQMKPRRSTDLSYIFFDCKYNLLCDTLECLFSLQVQIGLVFSPSFQDIGLKIQETFKWPINPHKEVCFVDNVLKKPAKKPVKIKRFLVTLIENVDIFQTLLPKDKDTSLKVPNIKNSLIITF